MPSPFQTGRIAARASRETAAHRYAHTDKEKGKILLCRSWRQNGWAYRRQHTFNTLPMHDANRFGGRTAYLREIGPIDHKKKGRLFKRDLPTLQFNVDVWCAQQTLRKQWKGRDWDVVEMPFEMAPKELQRVVPEKYTDVPMMADPARHDYMNIRRKVFDREDMQDALFASGGADQPPYPAIQRVDKAAMTLDKYL